MTLRPWMGPSPCCHAPRVCNETFDAYFCSACREWLERQCTCGPENDCPYSVDAVGPMPERAP